MKEGIQWMRASIAILDDKLDNIQMIEDESVWRICALRSCIRPETERRECSRDQWVVKRYIIEHCAIRFVGHELEGGFKLYSLGRPLLRDDIERDEGGVIHIVVVYVVVFLLHEWRRGRVGDGGCNILKGRVRTVCHEIWI